MSSLKMPDINNILIAGNLTNDPVLRKTSNGTPVANFHIASNRKFKDNTGNGERMSALSGLSPGTNWRKVATNAFEKAARC